MVKGRFLLLSHQLRLPHAIFTEHPELAMEIATSLNGVQVPRGVPMRVESPNFNDRPSTDFQADAVIVAGPARDPVRAVIVEAQKRTLHDKPPQWARYAAQLWTFLRCPVDVLVICPDAKAAFWYARPVPTTLPGYAHLPIILPPSAVPAIVSAKEAAARPAMAALSGPITVPTPPSAGRSSAGSANCRTMTRLSTMNTRSTWHPSRCSASWSSS
jgi:hypothetical protein